MAPSAIQLQSPAQYELLSDSDSDTLAPSVEEKSPSSTHRPQQRHRSPHLRRRNPGKRSRRESRLTWLRWAMILMLQSVMIVLLALRTGNGQPSGASPQSPMDVPAGGDINGIYHETPHKYVRLNLEVDTYMPNMTSNADRLEIRRRWDELMPRGSGSVAIPDYAAHPLLGEPIADDPLRSGPLFEASWTHALHCLYYSVDSYHQLLLQNQKQLSSIPSNTPPTLDPPNPHHASHCFEYLRTSIMCNLDMTLEGSYSAHRAGGGQAHVCRDRDAVVAWIEERRVDERRDIVGP